MPRFIVQTYVHSQGQHRAGGREWSCSFEGNSRAGLGGCSRGRVEVIVTGEPYRAGEPLAAIAQPDLTTFTTPSSCDLGGSARGQRARLVLGYRDLLTYEREGEMRPRLPFGGTLHTLDGVLQLLNGLRLEGARSMKTFEPKAARLFFSYSSKDEEFKAELETHLYRC